MNIDINLGVSVLFQQRPCFGQHMNFLYEDLLSEIGYRNYNSGGTRFVQRRITPCSAQPSHAGKDILFVLLSSIELICQVTAWLTSIYLKNTNVLISEKPFRLVFFQRNGIQGGNWFEKRHFLTACKYCICETRHRCPHSEGFCRRPSLSTYSVGSVSHFDWPTLELHLPQTLRPDTGSYYGPNRA